MNIWTVVPCSGSRAAEIDRLIDEVGLDSKKMVIVTTDKDPYVRPHAGYPPVLDLIWTGMHISKWWNAGLDWVRAQIGDTGGRITDPYEVFFPASDIRAIMPGGHETLAEWVRAPTGFGGMMMVGPNWIDQRKTVARTKENPRTIYNRIPGACFMIAGELGLRFDERFRWWYSDDDFERQHIELGPVCQVGGTGLYLEGPDSGLSTEQQAHAAEDRALYVEKWGTEPW